uniref:Tudor domain-containing protein n=1 Tax=Anopheles atroparvus TaxID=41427 RepID=A0A182J2L8_ANOAO
MNSTAFFILCDTVSVCTKRFSFYVLSMPPKRSPVVKTKMKPPYQSVPPKRNSEPAKQFSPAVKACAYCQNFGADFQCTVCGTLYCGVQCQLHDWLNHRAYQCIPRLEKATPVYVSPEFWANMANSQNPPHSNNFPTMPPWGKNAFQDNFSIPSAGDNFPPPAQAHFPQAQGQDNFPNHPAHANFPKQPAQANLPKQKAQANFPKQTADANFPKQPAQANILKQPAQAYFPQAPDQEHFPAQPVQANFPKQPADFHMTPTQAIVTKSKHLVQQQINVPMPMTMPIFSEPPPNLPKPSEAGLNNNGGGKNKKQEPPKKQEIKQKKSPAEKLIDQKTVKPADNRSSILSALLPNAPEAAVTIEASQPMPVASKKRSIPFLESGRKVRISHIGQNKLYVYGTGPEPDGATNRYLTFMKRSIESAREVKQYRQTPPSKCDIVFAPFEGEYYRAGVESIDGLNVSVIFPDFGNTATVAWTQLKDITNPEIKLAPPLVFETLIDNVMKFTKPQHDFLRTLVENEEFELTKVINMPNSYFKVIDLRHTQELYILSDKLRALPTDEELAKTTVPTVPVTQTKLLNTDPVLTETPVVAEEETEQRHPIAEDPPTKDEAKTAPDLGGLTTQMNLVTLTRDTYTPVLAKEFQDASLPTGNDVQLLIVDASELIENNTITVVLYSEMDRYNKVKDECDRIGKSDPHPYKHVQEAEACLIKRDGSWWRAVRCEAEDEYLLLDLGYTYKLLDLGYTYKLDKESDVRRYPAELSRELFTTDCIIDNPRMLQFAMACRENKDGLSGKVLKADVFLKDEVFHARILDLLFD